MKNEAGLAVHSLSTAPLPDRDWRFRTDRLIYFAGTETGPIKIGRTKDLRGRIKELRCASPEKLHVWAITKGGNLEEALYHHRFADSRVRGEWFERTPALLAEIARLTNGARQSGNQRAHHLSMERSDG